MTDPRIGNPITDIQSLGRPEERMTRTQALVFLAGYDYEDMPYDASLIYDGHDFTYREVLAMSEALKADAELHAMRLEGCDDHHDNEIDDYPTQEEIRNIAHAELLAGQWD